VKALVMYCCYAIIVIIDGDKLVLIINVPV